MKRQSQQSDLEAAFLFYWRLLGTKTVPEPIAEHEFCGRSGRDWRFDACWPISMVACELQGGTWSGGRHVRGTGYADDCEKLNVAQCLGWLVFWLTTDMLERDPQTWISIIADAVIKRQYIQSGKEIDLRELDQRKRPG